MPTDCILFDWLLVTRAWALGASLDFDATVRMAYRQYAGNVARVLRPFRPEEVSPRPTGARHSAPSCRRGWRFRRRPRQSLEKPAGYTSDFLAAVRGSRSRLDSYVAALNRLPPRFVWWWFVANPELENPWTH